jgi:xanthine dehydrogenase YagS FAD-binding subunit
MKAFEYAGPTSVDDALKLLGGSDSAAPLGGGTDLLGRMKDYVTSPERVVYLKDVKDLCGVKGDPASGLTVGAGTTLAELLAHKGVKEQYPALWQAASEVGTPQIKNMATIAGNLLQRPRCWYYRSGFGLLGMRDGKSMVREGDNRYHAIFLTDGNALYVNPSSLAVPLIALGAKATVKGARGSRTVAVEDLYQVPKREGDRELTVGPGELLTEVSIPAAKGKNASYEARQKQAHDWPLVMASVNLDTDGGRVSKARVVIYGVAPIPWRSEAAERAITGKEVTAENAAAAGEAAVEGAKPLSMNAYKVPLTRTVVKRALLLAATGKRYWEEA